MEQMLPTQVDYSSPTVDHLWIELFNLIFSSDYIPILFYFRGITKIIPRNVFGTPWNYKCDLYNFLGSNWLCIFNINSERRNFQ